MKLENLSATELGTLVNTKKISPVEVIDYFEERIKLRNPSINAFTYTRFDEARQRARELENDIMKGNELGPLAGVPVALKDFLPSKKGWTASHGGVKSLITVDEEDSMFCKSAESQGAIVVGKTNAPSFGFRGLTDNYMYGPTSTPFKIGYNSGGSSGGSCAAVADGLVYIAETGDLGGSGRIPAAWCGTFGFKPSAGLVPNVCRPDGWTATHPYCGGAGTARTVKDAALIMNLMQEYDPRDPLSVPLSPMQFDEFTWIKGMKIGVTYNFDLFPQPDPEIVQAIDECVSVLREAGAQVDYVKFDPINYPRSVVELSWLLGGSVDTAIEMELWKKEGYDLEKDHKDEVPEQFLVANRMVKECNILDYRKFHDIRTSILDSQLSVFKDYQLVIAPVAGCLPVKNADKWGETVGPDKIDGEDVNNIIGFGYTYLQNMTGYPAASVPFKLSKEGLPIGIQVVGRRYRDSDVFDVAHAIEEIHPWRDLYKIAYNRM